MSDPKIPTFDEWVKNQPANIPYFDEWAKQNPIPKDYDTAPNFKPSWGQDFADQLIQDAGNAIPNVVKGALGLPRAVVHAVQHPIDTAKTAVNAALDAPDELFADYDEHPAKAWARATELGLPFVLKGVGKLIEAPSGPLVESGVGIRRTDRAYGRKPGRAALAETSGLTPGAVADSAQARLLKLNRELEAAVNGSTMTADLTPARSLIDREIAKAQSRNATKTVEQLQQMKKFLEEPITGFGGATTTPTGGTPIIDATQTPRVLLDLKRGFGDEFVHNWNPETMHDVKGVAARVYHALDQELDRTVPAAKDLNRRVSSLIPVARRGAMTDLNAPLAGRLMHRVGVHTGALTGAVGGYYAGGPIGAAAGLVLPEVIGSPTGAITAGRAAYYTGRAIGSPEVSLPVTATAWPTGRQSLDEGQLRQASGISVTPQSDGTFILKSKDGEWTLNSRGSAEAMRKALQEKYKNDGDQ